MKTVNCIMVLDKITILDATPMFADVISGAVPRPEPFQDHPELEWIERPAWYHWAVETHAGQRALSVIGCTVADDGWRIQPWVNPGQSDILKQFGGAVDRLRQALGDPNAGTFFAEICKPNPEGEYVCSDQTLIAINVDGTRAAIAQ